MKQANLGRGLFILAMAIFFGYRYFSSGGTLYLAFMVALVALGMVSLLNYLPSQWQVATLNVGITLFFLDFVFANINLNEFAKALMQANYWMLIPSAILVLVHLYFRAVRWQWLLKPMGEVPFWPAFRAMSIGLAGNIVFPAKAGEFLRAYVLGRSVGLAKTAVFATLVVERIFDGMTILFFLVMVIVFGVNDPLLQRAGIVGSVVYVGAIIALITFVKKRHWTDALVNRWLPPHLAQRLLKLLDGFYSGLNILKNPRQLAMVLLLSVATWLFIPFSFWAGLLAFNFGVPILWQTPTMMLCIIALGLTLPSTPGGLGVFQAGVKVGLVLTLNQSKVVANFDEVAGAASIVVHVAQLIPQLIPGFISFWAEGLSTSEINVGQMDKG